MTLQLHSSVALRLDATKLPPDVRLDPVVHEASLHLDQLKLYRVSDVGGEIAQQLGRGVRQVVERKIADSNEKLADKINRQLAKKKDRLRLSLQDLLASKWADLAKHVKKAGTPVTTP
jgi:hypothetical protein